MKSKADLLLNIVLPLVIGFLVYYIKDIFLLPGFIKNYLADGLWAYAFISSILLIWEREINTTWITILFLVSVCFELLQYYRLIAGTGDIYDVATYLIFYVLALNLNNFFKRQFSN